jgi:hypothetical protein
MQAHPDGHHSDRPKADNVPREGSHGAENKTYEESEHERRDAEREGGGLERRDHSEQRHNVRDESLDSVGSDDSVSTEDSDSPEWGGEHGREKDRGDKHDGSKGDGHDKKDKKDDEEKGQWDGVLALGLIGLAHAAS